MTFHPDGFDRFTDEETKPGFRRRTTMEIWKIGTEKTDANLAWENFLTGRGLLGAKEVDGLFDVDTDVATKKFQALGGLTVDGKVGNDTRALARALGFVWPRPTPSVLAPEGPKILSSAVKDRIFGVIPFKPAPVPGNPEAIWIEPSWVKAHIKTIVVPQLANSPIIGAPKSGAVTCHVLAGDRILELFAEWQKRDLMSLVLSWAGCWVPRFVRGSRTTLSNHARGTAVDANAYPFNPLGSVGAPRGTKGSMHELAECAESLGCWVWGARFLRSDPMHLELNAV